MDFNPLTHCFLFSFHLSIFPSFHLCLSPSFHLCLSLSLSLSCLWLEYSETDNNFSIGENEKVGTKLTVGGGGRDKGGNTHTGNKPGSIKFTDPDLEDTHTFRIISLDDHDAFSLNSKTGELSLKKAVDFEKKSTYRLKVSVADSGGWRNNPLFVETWINIQVLDQNDAPRVQNSKTGEIDEELAIGSIIISDLFKGGEDIDAIAENQFDTFKFNDNDGATSNDGNLKIVGVELQTNKILDFETLDTDEDGEYTKMYEIYGIDKQSKKSNIMRVYITVNDVNEVPVNFVDYTIHVDENEAKMSACLASDDTKCLPSEVIADTSATPLDLDRDQALKYYFDDTSTDVDLRRNKTHETLWHSFDATDVFSIDEDSGLIKTINALDFESKCKKLTRNDVVLLWVLTHFCCCCCCCCTLLLSLVCSSFFFLKTIHTCTIFYSSHC